MSAATSPKVPNTSMPDPRVFAPAAGRNKQPILEVLQNYLGHASRGRVLEVACGTGEHTALFAEAMQHLTFQPTDCTPELFASVSAHAAGLGNVLPPRLLDARLLDEQWSSMSRSDPVRDNSTTGHHPPDDGSNDRPGLTAIVCINMTHISPYAATEGLIQGAGGLRNNIVHQLPNCPSECPLFDYFPAHYAPCFPLHDLAISSGRHLEVAGHLFICEYQTPASEPVSGSC
jgi:SAM-dependent methyltransferase